MTEGDGGGGEREKSSLEGVMVATWGRGAHGAHVATCKLGRWNGTQLVDQGPSAFTSDSFEVGCTQSIVK